MVENEDAQICLTHLVDRFHLECSVELGLGNYKKSDIRIHYAVCVRSLFRCWRLLGRLKGGENDA